MAEPAFLTLDVVLPTFDRAPLLSKTLDSLLAAGRPDGLQVTVIVVDNNSKDNTANVVRAYQERFPFPLKYVLEKEQGLSPALNAGIRAGTSDLVAMINDDEEVDCDWLGVIYRFFRERDFSFIGGPYYPNWETAKPGWISKEFGGIVGWVDGGDREQEYGAGFHGMLMGGNSVIRRRALEQVGLFNPALGRTDKGLLSCEDQDMFERLLAAGHRGVYVPALIIRHYIPAERTTRRYHRRWCWGRGTSLGVLGRTRKSGVVELFGIPRWQIRHAAVGLVRALKGLVQQESPSRAFEGELRLWDLAGYVYGRFLRRS